MIKLENVYVNFDNHKIIKDLSCIIAEGDFISIVGPNGAGKTTLLDLISGKVKTSSGKILIDDNDITTLSEKKRSQYIARLFQNTYMGSVASMTIRENLALAILKNKTATLKSAIKNFQKQTIEEVIAPLNLGLEKILDRPLGLLSGGQRQIIAFVMATLYPPRILLLDEPTAALDPASATKLLVFVKEFVAKHKITTLMITHDPNIAISLGNKLWILEQGRISKEFGPEKINLSPEHLIGHIDYEKLR